MKVYVVAKQLKSDILSNFPHRSFAALLRDYEGSTYVDVIECDLEEAH